MDQAVDWRMARHMFIRRSVAPGDEAGRELPQLRKLLTQGGVVGAGHLDTVAGDGGHGLGQVVRPLIVEVVVE